MEIKEFINENIDLNNLTKEELFELVKIRAKKHVQDCMLKEYEKLKPDDSILELNTYRLYHFKSLYNRLIDIEEYEELEDYSKDDYINILTYDGNIIEKMFEECDEIINGDDECDYLSSSLNNFIHALSVEIEE